MKKFLIIVVIIVCILGGVMYATNKKKNSTSNNNESVSENIQQKNSINEKTNTNNEVNENTAIVDKVSEDITQEEAEKLLEKKYGTVDEMTGNPISYSYLTKVKDKAGNKYYAFRESWLVDNDHLSFLQDTFVSLDGKTIKTASTPVEYKENQVVEFDEE